MRFLPHHLIRKFIPILILILSQSVQAQSIDGFAIYGSTATNIEHGGYGGSVEKYWGTKSISGNYHYFVENPFCVLCGAPEPVRTAHQFDVNLAWYKLNPDTKSTFYLQAGIGYLTGIDRGEIIGRTSGLFFSPNDIHEKIRYNTVSVPMEVGWLWKKKFYIVKMGFNMNTNFEDFYWPMLFLRLGLGDLKIDQAGE